MTGSGAGVVRRVNRPGQVLFASLIGTTIEFFDFYIYATAAVLVFPKLFFPGSDPGAAVLQSLATFGIAFLARPIGSALFGHFGDRIGRKKTLVLALLAMGLSTVAIGLLPGYRRIGVAAPLLLALCRFGQGIGLGGEWGGAVLLAIENAPPNRRAWYGMFPQMGAPIGFFLSGTTFLLLSRWLTDAQFFAWGWRLPFLASAVLVLLGLYVRLTITETPAFAEAMERGEQERFPMGAVFGRYGRQLVAGVLVCLATFVLFYLMTVFALSWGTTALHYSRGQFLQLQLLGVVFFAVTIPISALLAERGRRRVMMAVTVGIFLVWAGAGADVCRGDGGCGSNAVPGAGADGGDVWAAGDGDFGTVSDAGAVYGEFAGVQFGGHSGGFAGAVCRDVVGAAVWAALGGVLLVGVSGANDGGVRNDSGDKGKSSRSRGLRRASSLEKRTARTT